MQLGSTYIEAVVYVLACSTLVFALFSLYLLMKISRLAKANGRTCDIADTQNAAITALLPTLSFEQLSILRAHFVISDGDHIGELLRRVGEK